MGHPSRQARTTFRLPPKLLLKYVDTDPVCTTESFELFVSVFVFRRQGRRSSCAPTLSLIELPLVVGGGVVLEAVPGVLYGDVGLFFVGAVVVGAMGCGERSDLA